MILNLNKIKRKKIITLALLLMVFIFASMYKVKKFKQLPFYSTQSDVGLFTTESAFQYRYAKMVAESVSIPGHDKKAQWPEGVRTFKELTVFMEPVHGLTYRLIKNFFPKLPFHIFLIYFLSFFTSLAIIAVYSGVRTAGGDRWTALFCSAFYAFTGAAFTRITLYELEHFALPFIFFSFVFFMYAVRLVSDHSVKHQTTYAICAGLCLGISLCSWHFTRFYFLVFLVSLSAAFLLSRSEEQQNLFKPFLILMAFVILSGLVSPAMRYSKLLLSPQLGYAYVLLAGLGIQKKYKFSFKTKLIVLAAAIITGLLFFFISTGEKEYGHVWYLLKSKLLNFSIKPADPLKLPYEARVLWQGAFNTISPFYLIYGFGLLLPLSLIAGIKLYKKIRQRLEIQTILIFSITIIFAGLTVLIRRLSVFFVFFLALTLSYIPPENSKTQMKKKKQDFNRSFLNFTTLKIILLLGCLIFQIREAFLYQGTAFARTVFRLFPEERYTKTFLYKEDKIELFNWIRYNTEADAVFMSNFELSPSVLTYAGRAVNLQPKFETSLIREKFKEFITTVYGEDETAFYELLKKYQSDYFLYPVNNLIDNGPDSYRYLAGKLKLPVESLVYRFHFKPESFKYFKPVFRNKFYQIYKVLKTNDEVIKYKYPYYPVYDEELYYPSGTTEHEYFYEGKVDEVLRRIKYSYKQLNKAKFYMNSGYNKPALNCIIRSIENGLPDASIYYNGAKYFIKAGGDILKAIEYTGTSIQMDPANYKCRNFLAKLYFFNNNLNKAFKITSQLLKEHPDDPVIHNNIGLIYLKKGNAGRARNHFLKALEINPNYKEARKNYELIR